MMRSFGLTFIAFLTLFICTAGYNPDQEQRLKFLYIKNFIKNIEWPEDRNHKEFKIAIYGDKKVYDKISFINIKPEHANGKNISYYYFQDLKSIVDCQLIYITEGNEKDLDTITRIYQNRATLIICDAPGSCQKGAMIDFIIDEDHLSFEYNLENLDKAGLMYSSDFMEKGYKRL